MRRIILLFIIISALVVFFINKSLNAYCVPPCKGDTCAPSEGRCSLPSGLLFAEEPLERINRLMR